MVASGEEEDKPSSSPIPEPIKAYECHECVMLCAMSPEEAGNCFTPDELLKGFDLFCNVMSRTNAEGKSTLIAAARELARKEKWGEFSFLPEAKNRRKRLGVPGVQDEVYGVDLQYFPEKKIKSAIRRGQMFLAYEVHTYHVLPSGVVQIGKTRVGGITVRALRRAIKRGIRCFMTIPPKASHCFADVFPAMQTLSVHAKPEDHKMFRALRGISYGYEVEPFGWLDQYQRPPGLRDVINIKDFPTRAVRSVEQQLRSEPISTLLLRHFGTDRLYELETSQISDGSDEENRGYSKAA